MKKFYNFFLFRYQHQDYIVFSQARLTLNFCLITAIFSLLYVFIAHFIDFRESVITMSSLVILFSGFTFLIRYGVPLKIVSFLILSVSFIAALILVLFSGMIYSSILPWLSFIPLIAILLQGKTAAYSWLIACFLAVFALAYLHETATNIEKNYNKDYEVWFYAGVYNGLTGIILILSMIFQKAKDNVLKTLEEKNQLITTINHELKTKNNEILTQNTELNKQKEEIKAQGEFIAIKNRELLVVQDELNNLIEKLTATQHKLANREAENQSILNSIYRTELLVVELTVDAKILKVSDQAAKFLQLPNDEIIGKKFQEVRESLKLEIEDNTSFEDMWAKVLQGENLNQEAKIIFNDEDHWLTENFFRILDEDGNAIKVMIIALDISKIKSQQNEIEVLNMDLKDNIWKIEKQNSLLKEQKEEIGLIFNKLQKRNEEIQNINQTLEKRVKERTKNLEEQNKQLSEYAHINAHFLRGPLCSILGLVNLLENGYSEDENQIIYHLKKSSNELQEVVKKITLAIEKGSHFDKNLIE